VITDSKFYKPLVLLKDMSDENSNGNGGERRDSEDAEFDFGFELDGNDSGALNQEEIDRLLNSSGSFETGDIEELSPEREQSIGGIYKRIMEIKKLDAGKTHEEIVEYSGPLVGEKSTIDYDWRDIFTEIYQTAKTRVGESAGRARETLMNTKFGKFAEKYAGKIVLASLAGMIVTGSGLVVQNKIGQRRARELEKLTKEIYNQTRDEAYTAGFYEGMTDADLKLGRTPTSGPIKSGLFKKLVDDRVFLNPNLVQEDEDGVVYAIFDVGLGNLANYIKRPENFKFGSQIGKENLYSTSTSAREQLGNYAVGFEGENVVSIYNMKTGQPVRF
jgi:hypothetical protein